MQTQAYEKFRPAWDQFAETLNFENAKVESGTRCLFWAAEAAEDFIAENNAYVKALSNNERDCILGALSVVKSFLQLQADAPTLTDGGGEKSAALRTTNSKNRFPKKLISLISNIVALFRRGKNIDNPNDIEKTKPVASRIVYDSFLKALADFMAEIDSFAADHAKIDREIPKPPPFGKRTLAMLQEALGVFRSIPTGEAKKSAERLERYLRVEGATVVWPPRELEMETEEFFVIAVPGVEAPKDVQPFIQYHDIRLRGEKIIPGN